MVSLRKFGRDWKYITRSEWEEAKLLPTMVLAKEVNLTSKMDDAAEQILVDLVDDNGEKWRGIYTKSLCKLLKYSRSRAAESQHGPRGM